MDPVNLAKELPHVGGAGSGIAHFVGWLYEHPAIGIPVGILLICVLIVVMVRLVQGGGRKSKRDSN
jgi:hypothetical protein